MWPFFYNWSSDLLVIPGDLFWKMPGLSTALNMSGFIFFLSFLIYLFIPLSLSLSNSAFLEGLPYKQQYEKLQSFLKRYNSYSQTIDFGVWIWLSQLPINWKEKHGGPREKLIQWSLILPCALPIKEVAHAPWYLVGLLAQGSHGNSFPRLWPRREIILVTAKLLEAGTLPTQQHQQNFSIPTSHWTHIWGQKFSFHKYP